MALAGSVPKVMLEWAGEVTSREGEEIESRFRPAMENSLSRVDCDIEIGGVGKGKRGLRGAGW